MEDFIIEQRAGGKEPMPALGQAETGEGMFPYLYFPLLEETGIVKHCFTTRMGGVSQGYFESLNLSFARGDDKEAVKENFRRVSLALGTDYADFVFTDQTHTANVKRVGRDDAGKGLTRERDYSDIDGLITDEPGLVLSAFYADCVPLYFVDRKRRAIGLSHSGPIQKTCSVPWAPPSARAVMKSAKMWQQNFSGNFLAMKANFCRRKKMANISLTFGEPMKSSC